MAFFLGNVARDFGEFEKGRCGITDETHSVVNMDSKKTLGFRGDDEVK